MKEEIQKKLGEGYSKVKFSPKVLRTLKKSLDLDKKQLYRQRKIYLTNSRINRLSRLFNHIFRRKARISRLKDRKENRNRKASRNQ